MAFNQSPCVYWCPRWDSNPCYRRERAVSWAGLDDGDALTNDGSSCTLILINANNMAPKCQKIGRTLECTRHTESDP